MNRAELQSLADARVTDAIILLQAQRWQAAYYLLGYAIECALKACIAHQFRQDEVPEKTLVIDFYTHNLEKLLKIAGLTPAFDTKAQTDAIFRTYWNIVCNWNETVRYDSTIPEVKARDLLTAVTDLTSGVLPWVKTQW